MSRRQKVQCSRCKRRASQQQASADLWNMTFKQGVCVGHLCPNCQTPEENAEAEINAATTRYGVDAFGRMLGSPKIGETI
jgi:hypothetical protein